MRTSADQAGREDRSETGAVVMILLSALLYGSQYVAIKSGLSGFNPLLFGAVAMGIGGLLALAFTLAKGPFPFRIFRRWEVWAGIALATSMIACQYTGLAMATASIGGLIVGSNVIFVAPISALLFHEALGRRRAAAVVLGLLGLFTITTNWDLGILLTGQYVGYVLLLGASLSIALNYPLTRMAFHHMDYYEWTMSFHLLSPLPLTALALLTGGPGSGELTDLPFLLYVGLFCTSVPTMLWAKGLKSVTMTTSATILLSESAFAVILGALLLREPLTPITLLGAFMVFAAIFLSARGRGEKKRKGKGLGS